MYRSLWGLILVFGVFSLSPAFSEPDSIKMGDVLEYSPEADSVLVTAEHPEAPALEYECLVMPGDTFKVIHIIFDWQQSGSSVQENDIVTTVFRKIDGQKGSEEICDLDVKISFSVNLKYEETASDADIIGELASFLQNLSHRD